MTRDCKKRKKKITHPTTTAHAACSLCIVNIYLSGFSAGEYVRLDVGVVSSISGDQQKTYGDQVDDPPLVKGEKMLVE